METFIDLYKQQLSQLNLPALDDEGFVEALQLARGGDDQARRRICGNCLHIPLSAAERKHLPENRIDIFDLVREGNAALIKAIDKFTGSAAAEFVRFAEKFIEYQLDLIVQHPGYFVDD